jgi:hypothetical protein
MHWGEPQGNEHDALGFATTPMSDATLADNEPFVS